VLLRRFIYSESGYYLRYRGPMTRLTLWACPCGLDLHCVGSYVNRVNTLTERPGISVSPHPTKESFGNRGMGKSCPYRSLV
jgi:hypothetical protein